MFYFTLHTPVVFNQEYPNQTKTFYHMASKPIAS